jgi:cell division septation protein DedD
MGSLPARGAAVTPPLTIEQAIVRAALDVDPGMAQALTDADRPPLLLPLGHILDWSPFTVRLDERKQKLLAELLRCLQEGPWQLILLPDDAVLPPVLLNEGQLAALDIWCFDVAKSEIILGTRHCRVRVVPQAERTASPPDPCHNSGDAAMPADDAAAAATPQTNPAPAVRTEEEAEAAFVLQLAAERASTGRRGSRPSHFAWAARQGPFRVTHVLIKRWRHEDAERERKATQNNQR